MHICGSDGWPNVGLAILGATKAEVVLQMFTNTSVISDEGSACFMVGSTNVVRIVRFTIRHESQPKGFELCC